MEGGEDIVRSRKFKARIRSRGVQVRSFVVVVKQSIVRGCQSRHIYMYVLSNLVKVLFSPYERHVTLAEE